MMKILDKIIEGVESSEKRLNIWFLKKTRIESIDCVDKKFDPNFHQAMLEVENSDKRIWNSGSRDTKGLYDERSSA